MREADGSIRVAQEGEHFVATDLATGIASQGATREEAIANLAEALLLAFESD